MCIVGHAPTKSGDDTTYEYREGVSYSYEDDTTYEYLEGDRGFIEEAVKLWVEKNMPGEGDAFYSVPIPDKTHLDSLTTANIKALLDTAGVVVGTKAKKKSQLVDTFQGIERDCVMMRSRMIEYLTDKTCRNHIMLQANAQDKSWLSRSVHDDVRLWYEEKIATLTPPTIKEDRAAKKAAKMGQNSTAQATSQAERDRVGREGRTWLTLDHDPSLVCDAPDADTSNSTIYSAVYKFGESQTKASLTAPCKYVELMCKTVATLCALTVSGRLPPQVRGLTMGKQMSADLQKKQALTTAGAAYFGLADPAESIYHAVLHGLYPPEYQKFLAQGVGRAAGPGEYMEPGAVFALYDGKDGYLFQINIALFKNTLDWPHTWVDVRVSHIKTTCFLTAGSLPDIIHGRMNAAREKDFIKD
jgi:hypothetical protein